MQTMVTVEEIERRQRVRWQYFVNLLVERATAEHGEHGAQTAVAKLLGISSSSVSQATRGGRGFGPKTLAAAAAWGLRADYFTTEGPDDLGIDAFLAGSSPTDDIRALAAAVRGLQARMDRIPDPDTDTSRVRAVVKPPK